MRHHVLLGGKNALLTSLVLRRMNSFVSLASSADRALPMAISSGLQLACRDARMGSSNTLRNVA